MNLKRLSAAGVARLTGHTSMQDTTKKMVHEVLVNGKSQASVAAEFSVSKQRVNSAISQIETLYFADPYSDQVGTVSIDLELPHSLALELSKFSEALAGCNNKTYRENAVKKILAAISSAKQSL